MSVTPPLSRLRTSLASFRFRLSLFFVALVIVPMIAVALVLFRLISDSENGKADARVSAARTLAGNIYSQDARSADSTLTHIGRDPRLVRGLDRNHLGVVRHRARELASSHGARRLLLLRGNRVLVDVGSRDAIAPAARDLILGHRSLGQLQVALDTASTYAAKVKQLTGVDIAVVSDGRVIGTTVSGLPSRALPQVGNLDVGSRHFRVASFAATGFRGMPVKVSVLSDRQGTSSAVATSRLLAGGILVAFFVIAFTCAVLVSRSLQGQIASFLNAARRLGGGDFSAPVPVSGRDEFAALGDEFNKMSAQLEARLHELREQRARLESALQRIGEAFASNLDRDGLLEVVLRAAVDGVGAEGGRASARLSPGEPLQERARVGQVSAFSDLLSRVEADVLQSHRPRESGGDSGWALGYPLQPPEGVRVDGDAGDGLHTPAATGGPATSGDGTRGYGAGGDGARAPLIVGGAPVLGLISVARSDRAFTPPEVELFGYLAGQAAVSMENVSLHETVQRQAVTDELTGLYNHRRFQEALASELERSKRFEQDMSLVMLDIDNFKSINDTYGHQQGDLVLREVARILRENSREIDAPARYGGEELAVVLPQTDQNGAFNLAERVRAGIEELRLPLLDGGGTMSVTASLGVASLAGSAADADELVAAADAALYRAKRGGKNQTIRAQ
jgi:diguanylate cyclase (GGDEF)-like protein